MQQQRPPLVSWEHFFVDVTKEEQRFSALHAYLTSCVRPGERVIIFRNHGPKAAKCAMILRALGHQAAPMIGRMSDNERARTIQMFNSGQLPILVCTEIAVVSQSQQQHWNRADHIINWSFHWSSPAANSREYIARSDKGNGRIVSFVTIADSVTLQHLNSSLGFKMREVELDQKVRDEAQVLLDTWVGKEEMIRNREQDKLSTFIMSNVPTPSSTLLSSTSTSASSATTTTTASTSKRINNPHELGSLPSPAEAMANINAVMQKYRSFDRNNTNDDDESSSSSSSDEDSSSDDDDSSSSDDNNNNSFNNKRGVNFAASLSTPKKKKKTTKKKSSKKDGSKSSPSAAASYQQRDDGTNISPLRSRNNTRSNSLPRINDHHGLHSHVSLPSYSNSNTNNNSNQRNNMGSPIGERNMSTNKRSASRGKAASNNNKLCLPRQVDQETGKFIQSNQTGPFVARPGDEQLVEMIEAEMNLGHLTTKFDDIAGQTLAKNLLEEAVIFPTLMPNFFKDTRRPSKGILLFGPPGTGKTLLAKGVATCAKTTFFNVSPATLTSKWRGESEKLIRVLFEMARHYAPSTIFIDECDSLCGARGGTGEHEASRRAKSMLLQEMDGLCSDPTKTVMVLGATNHPWAIDEAMRRRFEQRIYIPLPSKSDRETLFKLNTRSILLASDVDCAKLSAMLEGKSYSGADIATLIRDAAMRPMRRYLYGGGIFMEENGTENKSIRRDEQELMEKRRKELYRNPQEVEEKLSKLPVTMDDFLTAMKAVPSSVNVEQVKKFEEWQKLFS